MESLWTDLTARDVMDAHPLYVKPSTSINELARVLEQSGTPDVPVLDPGGWLVGIVSRSALACARPAGAAHKPRPHRFGAPGPPGCRENGTATLESPPRVRDCMTAPPATAPPDAPLAAIARRMFESRGHLVAVVDGHGLPIGIVTSRTLLRLWPG